MIYTKGVITMGEAMTGLKRSHMCCDVSEALIGSEVTVMGWVQRRRDLGQLIFIALRDRTGIVQAVFDGNTSAEELFKRAETIRSEYVIAVKGTVAARTEGNVNKNMKTGEIEVHIKTLEVLGDVFKTLPFEVKSSKTSTEETRLKYRYLDLRYKEVHDNILF